MVEPSHLFAHSFVQGDAGSEVGKSRFVSPGRAKGNGRRRRPTVPFARANRVGHQSMWSVR